MEQEFYWPNEQFSERDRSTIELGWRWIVEESAIQSKKGEFKEIWTGKDIILFAIDRVIIASNQVEQFMDQGDIGRVNFEKNLSRMELFRWGE